MNRLVTAAVALPVIIASIVYPPLHFVFVALAVVATTLGLYEFWFLARKRGAKPDVVVGYAASAALLVLFVFDAPARAPEWLLVVVVAFVVAALAAEMLRGAPFDQMIASTGATVLGVLYVVLLGGHLVAVRMGFGPYTFLRDPNLSTHLLGFFFLVLMGSDTGAYYTGRLLGRHKLAPTVSPGKTWEGAVGGMLASLLAATIAHYWFFPELHLRAALPLAAVMNVLGVVGDLTESALKRGAGAKDAASFLPGHGGFLDRLDSLLFNAPLLYYFAAFYFARG